MVGDGLLHINAPVCAVVSKSVVSSIFLRTGVRLGRLLSAFCACVGGVGQRSIIAMQLFVTLPFRDCPPQFHSTLATDEVVGDGCCTSLGLVPVVWVVMTTAAVSSRSSSADVGERSITRQHFVAWRFRARDNEEFLGSGRST